MNRLVFIVLLLASAALYGQSVTDPTSAFNQVLKSPGVLLTDSIGDQATGQGADDFIVNGVFLQYGLANGVYTQVVRGVFTKYNANGFGGQFKVGVDATGDGAIDVFYGVIDSGGNRGISFQNPTGTNNNTVGTTTLGTAYNTIAFSASNYNYTSVGTNGQLTFSIGFSSLQSALSTLGITVNENSYLRYIFFTSTNQNQLNQDVYGITGINQTTTFTDSGAFNQYENFNGQPIPEPATYAQVGAVLGMAAFIRYKRRKKIV